MLLCEGPPLPDNVVKSLEVVVVELVVLSFSKRNWDAEFFRCAIQAFTGNASSAEHGRQEDLIVALSFDKLVQGPILSCSLFHLVQEMLSHTRQEPLFSPHGT